jgi:hypothetical protein
MIKSVDESCESVMRARTEMVNELTPLNRFTQVILFKSGKFYYDPRQEKIMKMSERCKCRKGGYDRLILIYIDI